MTKPSFEVQIRVERNEAWTRAAQASKENSMSPPELCQQWSDFADRILAKAFDHCFSQQKIALFALGKLGSHELNLSSDVDLLLVADEITSETLSSLRLFQKCLNERTAEGFVFRLDFDLRPGGRQGPLIPTLDQFYDYYGNYGETWERLAFVRLRELAGDAKIRNDVLAFAKKFSFRRHLDFTLFEDLKGLRHKIQSHYWERSSNGQVDLKLGIGGIRDVELFTHALLVVHGGKDVSLQVHETGAALVLLEEKNLLPPEDARFLKDHYWRLRLLENFVQAQHDEQTHLIQPDDTFPEFVRSALDQALPDMVRCDEIVKTLLGEPPEEYLLEQELPTFGFQGQELEELWLEIIGQEVLSRNRTRDEAARRAFLHEFLVTLKRQGGDIKRALLLLKDFIHGTRAKASFFSLLLRERSLLQKLTWLFGHSPYLSRILCNRPELIDSFVYRAQNNRHQDMTGLLEDLTERRLLSEVISGSEFLESNRLLPLLDNLSSTADSVTWHLLEALKTEYPSSLAILALGKWGGRELGFRSDLDFIFVLPEGAQDSDYKLARRFISRLTEPHRGGSIYSIDMRLRPSGKAGPLVLPLADLKSYLADEAAPWERQAYLKSRWINYPGPQLSSLYIDKGLSDLEMSELNRIRQQLIRSSNSHIDLKHSEGGLADIELASQALILRDKISLNSTSTLDFLNAFSDKGLQLSNNYTRLRQIEQMIQLVASESTSEISQNRQSLQYLASSLHMESQALLLEVKSLFADNLSLLKELDPRRSSH